MEGPLIPKGPNAHALPSHGSINDSAWHEHAEPTQGVASVVVSAFNLANTMIGLGTVTIPYAFRNTGLTTGLILLVLVIACGNYSYRALARCSQLTGAFSFKEVAELSFASRYAGIAAQVCVAFYTTGSCIAYIRVFGDYVPSLLKLAFPEVSWLQNDKISMAVVTGVLCFPMSGQKTLEKLKFASYLAIFGLACTVIALSVEVVHLGVSETVEWVISPATICLAFPLISVSCTGHHNLPRLYKELANPTQERTALFVGIANAICVLFYATVGVAGYLALGSATPGNILVGYDAVLSTYCATAYFWIAQFAKFWLLVAIICSFAMPFFAVRCSVEALLGCHDPSPKVRWGTTALLVGVMLSVAMLAGSVTVVFDVSGSTVGVMVVYIMPPLFLMRLEYMLWRDEKVTASQKMWWLLSKHTASLLVMIFGVSMSLWLLVFVIYRS